MIVSVKLAVAYCFSLFDTPTSQRTSNVTMSSIIAFLPPEEARREHYFFFGVILGLLFTTVVVGRVLYSSNETPED